MSSHRRQHQRSPYWTHTYRYHMTVRRVDEVLRLIYMPHVKDLLYSKTLIMQMLDGEL